MSYKKLTIRCDEKLDAQLDELLKNEVIKARRNNLDEPNLTDVIRMSIKEKYARDITGEEKDLYANMFKDQVDLVVGTAANELKMVVLKCHDKFLTKLDFVYDVLTKYNDITMLTSGFKEDDEEKFGKAINLNCVFKEMIEDQLFEESVKNR